MKNILRIIFNLILGGMLIFGGIKKFDGPSPSPTQMIDTIKKGEDVAPNAEILKIKNYIFGMKQTGYFWEFLGVMELLAGVLLVSQFFALFGAILALPLILNIFLFHYYLEPDETGELIEMGGLLLINLLLLGFGYKKWKNVLYTHDAFRFS